MIKHLVVLIGVFCLCTLSMNAKVKLIDGKIPKANEDLEHKPKGVRTFGTYVQECFFYVSKAWPKAAKREIRYKKDISIAVRVDSTGNVVKSKLLSSSGSIKLDELAMKTIQEQMKKSAPPKKYFYYQKGMLVEFINSKPWFRMRGLAQHELDKIEGFSD